MRRSGRYLIFVIGAGLLGALYVFGVAGMPPFGTSYHPYRDRAVHAGVDHETANIVSSVNFDQRSIDTLGEESIFFGSVIGAAALLRITPGERKGRSGVGEGRVLESTRFAGYILLPLTLLIGFDVVSHGHVTPGGGFQGGVVLATGMHLLYVGGSFDALDRLRPVQLFEYGEVLGTVAFAGLGIAAIAVAGSFLTNDIPWGTFGQFLSSGLVEVLNVVVGLEVACGVMVLLAEFIQQAVLLTGGAES